MLKREEKPGTVSNENQESMQISSSSEDKSIVDNQLHQNRSDSPDNEMPFLKEIKTFYVKKSATQRMREDAQFTLKRAQEEKDKIIEERVKLQNLKEMNDNRKLLLSKFNSMMVDIISYGEPDKFKVIVDGVKQARNKTPRRADNDILARTIAIGDESIFFGVLSALKTDLNIPTGNGELLINLAIKVGNVEIIKLLLHNPFDDSKTLHVNLDIADSYGTGPFMYFENNRTNLESYEEIKKELENAKKELDELYEFMQKSLLTQSNDLEQTINNFESKITNEEERLQLNSFISTRYNIIKKDLDKTILSKEQKDTLLKPLEKKFSRYVSFKTHDEVIKTNLNQQVITPPRRETKGGLSRFRSFTSRRP